MSYTRHGHHIPGTGWEDPPSTSKSNALCGGSRHCAECKLDEEMFVGTPKSWPEAAKDLLRKYLTKKGVAAPEGETYDIYLVWACKILKNWKGVLSTTLPDGMYYELTFDGEKNVWYVDDYLKRKNSVYKTF
jgi:hypothetical protein